MLPECTIEGKEITRMVCVVDPLDPHSVIQLHTRRRRSARPIALLEVAPLVIVSPVNIRPPVGGKAVVPRIGNEDFLEPPPVLVCLAELHRGNPTG